jgi:hypothetical protein
MLHGNYFGDFVIGNKTTLCGDLEYYGLSKEGLSLKLFCILHLFELVYAVSRICFVIL